MDNKQSRALPDTNSAHEFAILSPSKPEVEAEEDALSAPAKEAETLKLIVADQIQRLLSFYKELNCKGGKAECGRNVMGQKHTTEESQKSSENVMIDDRASFMERRRFSLHSNGMIAGGYEEKLCNAMMQELCENSKKTHI